MKRLIDYVSIVLLSVVSGCGQQLVEFGSPVGTSPADMAVTGDFATTPDLAQFDFATVVDMAVDAKPDAMPDMPVDAMPDMPVDAMPDSSIQQNNLLACVATFGQVAQSFGVLAGSTVTNTGSGTMIDGNVGVSPGMAVVGIPNGQPTNGSVHKADPVAAQAQMEVTATYTCLQAAVCNNNLTGTDLGGLTLKPGVYCFNSSAGLTGNLTFDANGDPKAIWFIQIMSTLGVVDNAQMKVIGGGSSCNVFWQVGSSVTIGKNAVVMGNMFSLASVTLNTGASVSGRALARTGAVTMDTNVISKCQ